MASRPDPPEEEPAGRSHSPGVESNVSNAASGNNTTNQQRTRRARDPSPVMMSRKQVKAMAKEWDEEDRRVKQESRQSRTNTSTAAVAGYTAPNTPTKERPSFPHEKFRQHRGRNGRRQASETSNDDYDEEEEEEEEAEGGQQGGGLIGGAMLEARPSAAQSNSSHPEPDLERQDDPASDVHLIEASLVSERYIPQAEVVRQPIIAQDGDHVDTAANTGDGNNSQRDKPGLLERLTPNTAAWLCFGMACLLIFAIVAIVVAVIVSSGAGGDRGPETEPVVASAAETSAEDPTASTSNPFDPRPEESTAMPVPNKPTLAPSGGGELADDFFFQELTDGPETSSPTAAPVTKRPTLRPTTQPTLGLPTVPIVLQTPSPTTRPTPAPTFRQTLPPSFEATSGSTDVGTATQTFTPTETLGAEQFNEELEEILRQTAAPSDPFDDETVAPTKALEIMRVNITMQFAIRQGSVGTLRKPDEEQVNSMANNTFDFFLDVFVEAFDDTLEDVRPEVWLNTTSYWYGYEADLFFTVAPEEDEVVEAIELANYTTYIFDHVIPSGPYFEGISGIEDLTTDVFRVDPDLRRGLQGDDTLVDESVLDDDLVAYGEDWEEDEDSRY